MKLARDVTDSYYCVVHKFHPYPSCPTRTSCSARHRLADSLVILARSEHHQLRQRDRESDRLGGFELIAGAILAGCSTVISAGSSDLENPVDVSHSTLLDQISS